MPRLQAEFFHQNTAKRNPTAPFLELDRSEIKDLMRRGMKRSERWRKMKYDLKKSDKEIIESFRETSFNECFFLEGRQVHRDRYYYDTY